MFSWTSRNSRASGESIWKISGIILANCESLVSGIRGLRIRHVCLWSVGVFDWRCYELDTSCAVRPEALVNTCAPTGCREKKEQSVSVEVVMDYEAGFLSEARKPIFSAMHELHSLSKAPWGIIIIFVFICFISCLFYFYFFLCHFHFLFHTNCFFTFV